jgi:ABC-type uncharacterized transport system permease subunit
MANQSYHRQLERVSPIRQRVVGGIFLLIAFIILWFFARPAQPGQITAFILIPGGTDQVIAPWIVPMGGALYALGVVCAILGGFQLARGFKKWTNIVLGIVVGLLKAVPITLGALSGILCERAGIVNIAIEGMMLSGAMVGALVGSLTKSLWMGLLAAIAIGMLMSLLLGWLSIKYKVNQIISGTVINILATGLTSYMSAKFMQKYQELNNPGIFAPLPIPFLSDIPVLGPILFNHNIFVYALFIFLVVMQVALFQTRWGLRMRAVGEHPKAADTLGIDVIKTRYMAVLLGGAMAGFAGGYFTLGSVGRFDEVMTAGRGFIGLAAMIFGNWMPFGSFGAGLLFGFADSLASRLAILNIIIPSQFMLMLPYIATMVILAGVVGRSQPPAAEGIAYEKE